MPSVRDNTKYRCKGEGCGTIFDSEASGSALSCPNCGGMNLAHLRITAVCDFCSTTENVRWAFPCAPWRDLTGAMMDLGPWAACDECKELVEARDREGLLRRWTEHDPDWQEGKWSMPPLEIMRGVNAIHQRYFDNRTTEKAELYDPEVHDRDPRD